MPIPNLTGVKGSVAISKGALYLLSPILLVAVIKVASGFDGSGTLSVWVGFIGGLMVDLKLTTTQKGFIIF